MIHWFYDSPNIACFSRLHNSTSLAQQPTSVARARFCFCFVLLCSISLTKPPRKGLAFPIGFLSV